MPALDMAGLQMDQQRHRVCQDGEWVRAVRRNTGNENIFVYFHTETLKFVVCEWMVKPTTYGQGRATCTELFCVSGAPDHDPADLPTMEWIRNRCRPLTDYFDEHLAERAEERYREVCGQMESHDQSMEASKMLQKLGDDEGSYQAAVGASPRVGEGEGGELLKEMTEELTASTDAKIFSSQGGKPSKHRF